MLQYWLGYTEDGITNGPPSTPPSYILVHFRTTQETVARGDVSHLINLYQISKIE